MTSPAARPLTSAPPHLDRPAADALAAANINPRTGLATDYLNHFNEAIMLLEMVSDLPECAADFLEWRPLSYREHFSASNLKARDLAVAAYEHADTAVRHEFDRITSTMTAILVAVGAALREAPSEAIQAALARQAADWAKPLAILAAGIINGSSGAAEPDIDSIMMQEFP